MMTSAVWPIGESEMARRIRAYDWAATPLGPIGAWTSSLRTAVDLTLASPVATILLWGPADTQIYNDLWRNLMGAKHPDALGQPTHECFPEIADTMRPLYEQARRGEAVILHDKLLPIRRDGEICEAWWDVYYAPVRDEVGDVAGLFCTVIETTKTVLAARERTDAAAALRESEGRQAFLLKLSDALRPIADPLAIQETASRMTAEHLDIGRVAYCEIECQPDIMVTVERDWPRRGMPSIAAGRYRLNDYGPFLAEELTADRPAIVADAGADPRLSQAERENWSKLEIVTSCALPVTKEGRLVAYLVAQDNRRHDWTDHEVALLREISERTWAAVERARAEALLRAGQDRLRRALECDAVGVLFFDKEGCLVDANEAFLRTTGYTRCEMEARALHWRDMTPPEYIAAAEEEIARFAATGRIGPYEKEYFLRDGSRRWMLFAGQSLGDGSIIEYCVDISERKAAEAALREADTRLRTMADTAPVLIWEADARGVTFVNAHYLDFFGVSFEKVAGMGWAEFLHPDDKAGYLSAYDHARETRSPYTYDCRFLAADGSYHWLRNIGRPLNEHRFIGASTDVTERIGAELALKEADRRKDEFIATLAHELRNPLAPIRNAAYVLQRKHGAGSPDAPLIDMIRRQSDHLVRLVDDLLEISRINRGKIALRKESVAVGDFLRDAVDSCEPVIDKKRQRLIMKLPPEPLFVHGDRVRLTQIAANIVSNAAKYTPTGGDIEISAAREGGGAVFRVRDNGVGVSADMMPRIFDLFAQADAPVELSEGGLGIGLALVRKLVELHGGRVEAKSEGPDKGSEFVVWLPIVETLAAASDSAWSEERRADGAVRVLVIDDDHDVADSFGHLLESLGAEVSKAYDGASGALAVDGFGPDVIFVDIGMPGVDGYETARRIRHSSHARPFNLVALTGWGQDEDRQRAFAAGFDLHLTKPASIEAIQELLRKARRPLFSLQRTP